MIHEDLAKPSPRDSWKAHLAQPVTKYMLAGLVRASNHVFLSTSAWEASVLPRLRAGTPMEVLPVPSNIDTDPDGMRVRAVRCRIGCGSTIGHFGTFSAEVTTLLEPAIRALLTRDPRRKMILVGDGSVEFAQQLGTLGPQLVATGKLPSQHTAEFLKACDLMLQPFPDGVTSRRSSIMAALALGVPVVTNPGPATERFWESCGAIELARDFTGACEGLLADPARRGRLSQRARALYQAQFSLEHSVRILRARARIGEPTAPTGRTFPHTQWG